MKKQERCIHLSFVIHFSHLIPRPSGLEFILLGKWGLRTSQRFARYQNVDRRWERIDLKGSFRSRGKITWHEEPQLLIPNSVFGRKKDDWETEDRESKIQNLWGWSFIFILPCRCNLLLFFFPLSTFENCYIFLLSFFSWFISNNRWNNSNRLQFVTTSVPSILFFSYHFFWFCCPRWCITWTKRSWKREQKLYLFQSIISSLILQSILRFVLFCYVRNNNFTIQAILSFSPLPNHRH